jgi:hypothetical protein
MPEAKLLPNIPAARSTWEAAGTTIAARPQSVEPSP